MKGTVLVLRAASSFPPLPLAPPTPDPDGCTPKLILLFAPFIGGTGVAFGERVGVSCRGRRAADTDERAEVTAFGSDTGGVALERRLVVRETRKTRVDVVDGVVFVVDIAVEEKRVSSAVCHRVISPLVVHAC